MPRDIVAAVDAIVDAPTPAAAVDATRKALGLAGVVVSDSATGRPESAARMYVTTAQLETMAYEAQHRATLSRVTFREFATTLAGTGALPLAAAQGTSQPGTARVKDQPMRLAAFLTRWVALAEKYHASSDLDEVALTHAPLLVAGLAARQEEPIDLREGFLPSELRLGSLDVTLLVAGLRRTLLAARKDVPPRATTAPSATVGSTATPTSPTNTSPTLGPSPSPTPGASASPSPSRSPAAAVAHARLAQVAVTNAYGDAERSLGAEAGNECNAILESLNGSVPGAGDLYSFAMGERIKSLVGEAVKELMHGTDVAEQRLGVLFEVLGILFRIQTLVLLYQSAEVKTELSARSIHKATDAKTSVTAKVTAGIPDEKWEQFKRDRESSPVASRLRECARALGLPLPANIGDIGEAMKSWRVAWDITRGSPQHAELPGDQFLGPGRVAGRLERPLELQGDHKATDSITVNVTAEQATDHPGREIYAPVVVCSYVRTAEPPNLKTLLSAGISGSGAGDMPITGDAKKIASASEKLLGPAAIASLVATIVDVLAGWFQFSYTLDSCARMSVTYHVPKPGQWTGTVEIRSEYEDSSTYSGNDGYYQYEGQSRRTVRSNHELHVSGMDMAMGGGGASPMVLLTARQLSYGFVEDVAVTTSDGTSRSGCRNIAVDSKDFSGTYSYTSENGSAQIALTADGKYTLRISPDLHTSDDIQIPGTDAKAVQVLGASARTCVPNNFSRRSWIPAEIIGMPNELPGGRLDPRNPGSRLAGSQSFFNEFNGATTIVTWDLRHEGPIRLPTR